MEACAVIAADYGKSLLSEIKTLDKFTGSGPPSDVLSPVKTLHDLARLYIGEDVLDELLTDNFTGEQIWQQLKLATSCVEKTFENASVSLHRKRKRIVADITEESVGKKLCPSGTADDAEDASDAESDDELKRITDRWNIDRKQSEEEDEDSEGDEDDEMEKEDEEMEKDEEDAENDLKEDFDKSDDESPLDTLRKALKSKKKKTSEVDDKFFSLEEMNLFVDQQERLANREVNEAADADDNDDYMFRDISSDEDETEEKNAKYSEFFGDLEEKTKGDETDEEDDNDDEEVDEEEDNDDEDKDVSNMEHSGDENGKDDDETSHDDDDDEEESMEHDDIIGDDNDQQKESQRDKMQKTNNEPKSAFQRKQELLKKQIGDVEESNLAEKPWHLRGEITAADRPENSLLTTHLDYKFNSAPMIDDDKDVITIEELLRKYYDSEAFVINVTRKVKPVGTTLKYRKDIVLDHEKSKLGLAEVLERDYLGQTQTRNQKEEEEYKENRKILDNLLLGLKMMFSNTPVTVMPPKMDLEILENVPAIMVEEVAPVFVSDAARLTAEEVQGKRKGELVGATEKTQTNRKRERRLKKKFQHEKALQKKVRAADPNTKEAQEEAQKQLERKSKRGKHITIHETDKKKKKLSSKDFFNQLQNQVTSSINKKREGTDKKKRKQIKLDKS